MGFSSEAIFVKTELKDEMIQKITELTHGDPDVVFNREIEFDTIASSPPPGIFFGQMNQSFYMIYDYMSHNIFEKQFGDIQGLFTHLFPKEEILFITNVESANAYVYHLIVNGKTKRKKVGFHPNIVENIGDELPTEKAYYVKKEVRDGQEFYYTKSYYKEGELDEYTHDQVGGSIAFKLVKDMTGCEYMSQETDGFKAKEYLLKKRVQDMLDFLEGKSANPVLPELKKGLPVSVIKDLIQESKEVLLTAGFHAEEDGIFIRKNEGLNQIINFSWDTTAAIYSPFNIYFSQNTGYKEWHLAQFGTDRLQNGQTVQDHFSLNFHELQIEDKNQTLFTDGSKTKQELKEGLLERLKEVIIPAFDKSTISNVTSKLSGIRKADFHLMNNELDIAKTEMEKLRDTLIKSSIKQNWDANDREGYFKMLESRNKFFESPIEYREYFNENFERIKTEVEEQRQQQKEEQEKARIERELRAKEAEIQIQKEALTNKKESIVGDAGVDPVFAAIIEEDTPITLNEVKNKLKKLYELSSNQRKSDHSARISVLEAIARKNGITNVAEWAKQDKEENLYKNVVIAIVIIIVITLFFMR